MKKVLCLVSYFHPGYRAGGPIKTIINMISQLKDDLQFSVITRNHDLGSQSSFSEVNHDEWNEFQDFRCFYCSKRMLTIKETANLINSQSFDVLYLNSFFDVDLTIRPLIARKLGLIGSFPVVLAPRGEFSTGALSLKPIKKRLYIKFAKSLGLLNGIIWQASTPIEKRDIVDAMRVDGSSVFVAKDLPSKIEWFSDVEENVTISRTLRIVFLSRISPMKNLKYALEVLEQIKIPFDFDIYGPIEDQLYWQECQTIIDRMEDMAKVRYQGVLSPDEVPKTFAYYDLFFFPTMGENFGHVVAEALSVGTPVLLSDQTPWRNLDSDQLGWDVSLSDTNQFVEKILAVASMDIQEKVSWRRLILQNVVERLDFQTDRSDNVRLFNYAVGLWESRVNDKFSLH